MSWCISLWIYHVWDALNFLDLSGYYCSNVREIFDYNLFKYFLIPFLFLFFFWDPYNLNVDALNVVPALSETVLIYFIFPLFSSASVISTIPSSSSLTHHCASGICYWFLLVYF